MTYLRNAGETEAVATERARQAVAEQLRAEPQDVLDNHVRSIYKSALAPPGWDPIDDWASAIVDALKTDVHAGGEDGAAGKLHADLLASVANGRTPTETGARRHRPLRASARLKGRTGHPRWHRHRATDRQLRVQEDPQPDGQHLEPQPGRTPSSTSGPARGSPAP